MKIFTVSLQRSLGYLLPAILLLISFPHPANTADSPSTLAKGLEPLRPFLGKTFKGPFANSTPEKPTFDVMRWERILNGQGIRITHSVNEGAYGGETIVTVDPKSSQLQYHYFTTTGMMTRGSMSTKENTLTSHEEVIGNADGITEVKSTTILKPDGKIHVKSQYFKKGEWVQGHEILYTENPTAAVIFR